MFAVRHPLAMIPFFWVASVYANGSLSASGLVDGECQSLKTKEEYCQDYQETQSLKNDSKVAQAREKCLVFYGHVIAAAALVCEYRTSFVARSAAIGQRQVAAVGSQSDSFSGQVAAIGEIRNDLNGIRDRAVVKDEEIRVSFEESARSLRGLSSDASAILQEEIHCQKNGRSGRAPSFLLVGLAASAASDQEKTQRNFRLSLRFLLDDSMQAGRELNRIENQTRAAGKGLGNNRDDSGGGAVGGALALAGMSLGSVDDPAAAATQRAFQAGAQRVTTGAPPPPPLTTSVSGFLPRLVAFLSSRGGAMGTSAAGGALPRIIFGGQFDQIAIANIGVNVVAAALGVGFLPATIVGVATAAVEAGIRRDLGRLDREIRDPYIQWARGAVREMPTLDSAQLAQRYETIKRALPYCGTCGFRHLASTNLGRPAGERVQCPAHNPFNENWRDMSSPWGSLGPPRGSRSIETP